MCGAQCIDSWTDESNCGACGTVCTGGKQCYAGTCKCATGQVECGGVCTNLGTNTNCSGCGIACPADKTCSQGACVCKSGTKLCPGSGTVCIDTQNDKSNCGACGVVCVGNKTCQAGVCK